MTLFDAEELRNLPRLLRIIFLRTAAAAQLMHRRILLTDVYMCYSKVVKSVIS